MNLPTGATAIVRALYDQHLELARGSDDDRRRLTLMMAQTFVARFGPRWGVKATSKTAPQSKDSIAFDGMDGTFDVFDWQNGTTREPQVRDGQAPTFARIGNQFFIDVVPHDFLAPAAPVEQPGTPASPSVGDIDDRLVSQMHVLAEVIAVNTEVLNVLIKRLEALSTSGLRVHL